MSRLRYLSFLLPFLALGSSGENVYKQRHTYKVRFNPDYRFNDKDRNRQLIPFRVHGETIMAYSHKDAIKRWVHQDLKHRRKKRA